MLSPEGRRAVARIDGYYLVNGESCRWRLMQNGSHVGYYEDEDRAWDVAMIRIAAFSKIYQHDGGVVLRLRDATELHSGQPLAVFEHVWPDTHRVWVVDREEFERDFRRLMPEDFESDAK